MLFIAYCTHIDYVINVLVWIESVFFFRSIYLSSNVHFQMQPQFSFTFLRFYIAIFENLN